MEANPFDQFDDQDATTNPFDQFDEQPEPERSVLKDTGVSIAKGLASAGESVVGLADIPLGGRLGKSLDTVGLSTKVAKDYYDSQYSPAQQKANRLVSEADGIIPTVKAYVENPSAIYHHSLESLPAMALGGAGGAALKTGASRLIPAATKKLSERTLGVLAGSAGEGLISAGQQEEQVRQQEESGTTTAKQGLFSVGAGIGTSILGFVGGRLAQRFGFADADTFAATLSTGAKKQGVKDIAKAIVGGGISESVFEEMPQSVQEQVWMNAATGKPLLEGTGSAAGSGAVLGFAMGAGVNMLPGSNAAPEDVPLEQQPAVAPIPADDQELEQATAAAQVAPDDEDLELMQEPAGLATRVAQKATEIFGSHQDEFPVVAPQFVPGPTPSTAEQSAQAFQSEQPSEAMVSAEEQAMRGVAQPAGPATVENSRRMQRAADAEAAFSDRDFLLPKEIAPALRKMERQLAESDKSGAVVEGQGNEATVTGGFPATTPDWFKQSTLKAYDKKHGTDLAKTVNARSVASVLARLRNDNPLTERLTPVWHYMQEVARDISKTDPEVVAEHELNRLEKEGFQFDAPQSVPAGTLKPGDEVVVDKGGVPDKLVHKGFDKEGKAILKDGQTLHVDPFEQLQVIASKQQSPITDAEEQWLVGMAEKLSAAEKADVENVSKEIGPYFEQNPHLEPYREMIEGAVERRLQSLKTTTGETNEAEATAEAQAGEETGGSNEAFAGRVLAEPGIDGNGFSDIRPSAFREGREEVGGGEDGLQQDDVGGIANDSQTIRQDQVSFSQPSVQSGWDVDSNPDETPAKRDKTGDSTGNNGVLGEPLQESRSIEAGNREGGEDIPGRGEGVAARSVVGEVPSEAVGQPESVANQPQKTSTKENPNVEEGKGLRSPEVGEQFANNKIFTSDAVSAARERLNAKRNTLRSGFDPEMLQDVFIIGGAHFEQGVRRFADWTKAVIADIGEEFRPFLRGAYENLRYTDGLDKEGMSSPQEIDDFLSKPVENLNPSASSDTMEEKGGDTNVADIGGNTNLEQDSENASPENRVGKKGVQPGSRGNERAGKQRVPATEGKRGSGGSSAGISRHETAVAGERSDLSPYSEGSQPGSEGSPSRIDNDIRGGDIGLTGAEPDKEATGAVEKSSVNRSELVSKFDEQKAVNNAKVMVGDRQNISDTLPLLKKQQQDDVIFAEKRFSKPDGYGVLFTNGTGTGKTFSALGIVKRFERQGKKNILVVAPDDLIIDAWSKASAHFDLEITRLKDTKDSGSGIVITTYANFGANESLAKRKWDLIVADESHQLGMNKAGDGTSALSTIRAISLHPRGAYARARAIHSDLYNEVERLAQAIKEANSSDDQRDWHRIPELEKKMSAAWGKWQEAQKKVEREVANNQGEARPRVVFLSATPFAYEKNVDVAEGYLFEYPKAENSSRYNSGDSFGRFMMQHFGYRMRYNKLTEPDKEVNRGLMQRQFNSWLKKEGVLSSRVLDVDFDYDRKFNLVESAVGSKIDEGMEFLWNTEKYRVLHDAMQENFDYLSRRYLLEAIKAKEIIPVIKEHLALGRKVVVFHDYIKGGGFNPFDFSGLRGRSESVNIAKYGEKENNIPLGDIVRSFEAERPDLVNLPLSGLASPLSTLQKAFPDLLVVNGQTVTKKEAQANVAKFNSDETGPAILMVQSDKDKGWSGHDTSGKYQRVLINLGLPTRPTRAIQQEGRIYRVGQASDAIIRYINTGTNWERWAFASTIAQRASTAENLAMGEEARALLDSFIQGFEESDLYPPGHEGEGKGGKERDAASNSALTEWDRAITLYYAQQKKTSRTKADEGKDYFATPEPLALKMVEWANVRGGEDMLEPSAGHGAIARWFPENVNKTVVEPSSVLASRLKMVTDGRLVQSQFEDLNIVNKYDAIVMNPPFGTAGKTAMDHIEKAYDHLRDGGRIVALIPAGPSMDKRLDKFLYGEDAKGKPLFPDIHLVSSYRLPSSVFERAGTKVNARIVILDKLSDKEDSAKIRQTSERDYSGDYPINEFFERIKESGVPDRISVKTQTEQQATGEEVVEHTTQKGKVIRGAIRKGITKDQAKEIDAYSFKKDGGWFIREKYLSDDQTLRSVKSPSPVAQSQGDMISYDATSEDLQRLGLKENEADYEAVEVLERMLRKEGEKSIITPWRLPDSMVRRERKGRINRGPVPTSSFEFAEKISRIFDKKIVWITADGISINGIAVPNNPHIGQHIFIDVRADHPAHIIYGHELAHHLKKSHPEEYAALVDALSPLIKDHALSQKQTDLEISEEMARDEIIADLLGDAFGDSSFWDDVAAKSPSMFRRVAKRIRVWINNLLNKMSSSSNFGSESYVTDLKATRSALARLIAETRTEQGRQGLVDRVMRSVREVVAKAKAFYSKLGQVSSDKFTGMKAQSVEPFLLKQGVKKAEIEAIGLREWLATMKPTDKVTKEQLADFVRANTVEFEDVVLTDKITREDDGAGGFINTANPTHFSQYTEPGADQGSYREMFITAPSDNGGDVGRIQDGDIEDLQVEFDTDEQKPYVTFLYKGEEYGTYQGDNETEIESAKKKIREYFNGGWSDGHSQYDNIQNPIVRIRFNTVNTDGKKTLRIEEMQGPSDANQSKMPKYLKENLYQIGVKRIIAYAKENGFDAIAFAKKEGRSAGETQADRYSLEKQVDSIDYHKTGEDQYSVWATKDQARAASWYDVGKDKLSDIVGKEIARKIIAGEGKRNSINKIRTLSGIDLSVGGEGLKQLYDKDLPNIFKAFGKDEMIDGVMPITDKTPGAFPMFSLKGKEFKTVDDDMLQSDAFRRWFGRSVTRNPNTNQPYVFYHNSPSRFYEFDLGKVGSNTGHGSAGLGFFFGVKPNTRYGAEKMKVLLRLEKPYRMGLEESQQFDTVDKAVAFREKLQGQGHDGIIMDFREVGGNPYIVVFSPNQVKSAEVNTGEFSRRNNDVRRSKRKEKREQQNAKAEIDRMAAEVVGKDRMAIVDDIHQNGLNPTNEQALFNDIITDEVSPKMTKDDWFSFLKAIPKTIAHNAYSLLTLRQLRDIYRKVKPVEEFYQATRDIDSYSTNIMAEANDVYNNWAALPKKVADAMSNLMTLATVNGVNPDRDYEPRANVKLFRQLIDESADVLVSLEKEGTTDEGRRKWHDDRIRRLSGRIENERERFKAYKSLKAQYDAMPQAAKDVYQEVREMYDANLFRLREALLDRMMRVIKGNKEQKLVAESIRLRFEKFIKEGPYFPLSRFGEYIVTLKDKNGNYERHDFDFAGQRDRFIAKMEKETDENGQPKWNIKTMTSKEYSPQTEGATSQFVVSVANIIKDQDSIDADEKVKLIDEVNQLYIKSMPDLSHRKHFAHRRKVEGYSRDQIRSFAQNMQHAAHHIARIKHSDKLTQALVDLSEEAKQTEQGDVSHLTDLFNELNKRHQMLLNPQISPVSQVMTSFGFIQNIGPSIASALVNFSQTPLVAFPVLAARFNDARGAFREFRKASTEYLTSPTSKERGFDMTQSSKLSNLEKGMLNTLMVDGTIEASLVQSLAQATSPDLLNMAKTKHGSAYLKAMKLASYPFHVAELANRQITAVAAYRLAMKHGAENLEAINQAREIVLDSHFDYTAANRARFMEGNVQRVLFLFKQYSQQMTYLLARSFHQAANGESQQVKDTARKQLLGVIGGHFLVSGLLGMPVVGMLGAAMQFAVSALGDDDEPWDWEVELRNMVSDATNPAVGEAVVHGPWRSLPVLGNWDISSRVSLGDLWFRSPDREAEGIDKWNQLMNLLAGPIAANGASFFQGMHLISEGDAYKGIEKMLPKSIKDMMKAIRYSREGVTNYHDNKLIDDVSAIELFGQVLGFTPRRVSEKYEQQSAIMNRDNALEKRHKKLVNRWAEAVQAGDVPAAQAAMREAMAFSQKHPGYAVTGQGVQQSVRMRNKVRAISKGGIYLPVKRKSTLEEGRFANL